jgi:hypothetical protein
MNYEIVVYDNQGWREFRKVPFGTQPTKYSEGILIGPPSIESLNIPKSKKKELNNFLVDSGIVSYENLLGNKRHLLNFIYDLGLKDQKEIELRNSVIGLYQRELVEADSEED